jgi:hypothetical protein
MKIVNVLLLAIVLAILLGALFALPVMWLWNACLVPAVSGISEIGFLQAWGIYVLGNIMFKSSASKTSD